MNNLCWSYIATGDWLCHTGLWRQPVGWILLCHHSPLDPFYSLHLFILSSTHRVLQMIAKDFFAFWLPFGHGRVDYSVERRKEGRIIHSGVLSSFCHPILTILKMSCSIHHLSFGLVLPWEVGLYRNIFIWGQCSATKAKASASHSLA